MLLILKKGRIGTCRLFIYYYYIIIQSLYSNENPINEFTASVLSIYSTLLEAFRKSRMPITVTNGVPLNITVGCHHNIIYITLLLLLSRTLQDSDQLHSPSSQPF